MDVGDRTARRDAARDLEGVELDPHDLPRVYVAPDVPGVGGLIKQRPEDFVVEEIPLYEPSGEGEHAYLCVRRRSLATLDVVRMLASHFKVPIKAVGYAGLKDKHAVTTQVFSIRLVDRRVEDFPPFERERVEVRWASRHTNKLRRGHLKGNRFTIRIRGAREGAAADAARVLERLATVGAPARLGEQRFGHLRRNHLLGRCLVLGECRRFLDLLLGPCDDRPNAQAEARALYAEGRYRDAQMAFPRSLRPELVALRALVEGADAERAVLAIGRVERSFFGSAMQSAAFNLVLDERLADGTLASLGEGDIAMSSPKRGIVDVDADLLADPETAGRVATLGLSPTGPMWGRAMRLAKGDVGEAEAAALARLGLRPEDIDRSDRRLTGPLEGARRPLRVPIEDHHAGEGADEHGPYLECAFTLPRGAFATTVIEEITKAGRATMDG